MKHPLFSIDNCRHSTKAGFREQTTSGSPVGAVSRERSERFVARSAVSLRENAVFFLLSLFLLTSCEEEIPYNGPDEEGLMVVSCIATAGEPLSVAVTRSVFFLEPIPDTGIDIALADASVTATIDGHAVPLAYDAESAHFVGTTPVEAGTTVTVTAVHPRYGTSSATVTVPQPVPVTVTTDCQPYRTPTAGEDANRDIHVYARTDSLWTVTLHVGNPDDSGCYRLTVESCNTFALRQDENWHLQIEEQEEGPDGTVLVRNGAYFVLPPATSRVLSDGSGDDILEFLGIDVGDGSATWHRNSETFLFTRPQLEAAAGALTLQIPLATPQWYGGNYYWYHPDEHYLGYNYTYEGEDYENYDYGNPWNYVDPRSFVAQLTLTVETLSPEYHAYIQSLKDYENTDFSLIGLFSEPVQVYSNTTAGIGILAAEARQTITLTRPYVFELPTE